MAECSYSNGASLCELRVTPQAIKTKLMNLDINKAQGPDMIPPRVLKELSNELSVPLSSLFNKSLETGTLPSDWNTAVVTALFKKGVKSDPGNYRPVSLTCVTSKILEDLIRDAMVSHLQETIYMQIASMDFKIKEHVSPSS